LDIIADSGSDRAFDRATKWLSRCLDHDEKCGSTDPKYLPRRLLNIGSSTGSHDPILFEPTEPVHYVCLSYCWGPDVDDVLTTKTENLKMHYQGIPLSSLPQTIRDAVVFCRGLKLQYLWVDSLCIVKDDNESKLTDIANMHEIYSNAFITLTIKEPASCKTGFLGKQRFGSNWQQKLDTQDLPEIEHATIESFVKGQPKALFTRPFIYPPHGEGGICSLDMRGWCLQESILSKRKLCFDGNEMSWECAHRTICECGHVHWDQEHIRFTPLGHLLKESSGNPFESWRQLVENYTARHLTDDGDKLIAISALAKLLHSGVVKSKGEPPTYLAGLWKEDLLRDLTWSVVQSKDHSYPRKLAPQYRAPTWSWASIDMPVQYKLDEELPAYRSRPERILECDIDDVVYVPLQASDPTGPISPLAAYVQITAALACVCKKGLQKAEIFPDRPDDFDRWGEDKALCSRRCCRSGAGQDELPLRINASYYLLRLFAYFADSGHCKHYFTTGRSRTLYIGPYTWFLILKNSSTVEGAYERIGIGRWRLFSDTWNPGEECCPLFQSCTTRSIKIV
jgi:hypothetical protein